MKRTRSNTSRSYSRRTGKAMSRSTCRRADKLNYYRIIIALTMILIAIVFAFSASSSKASETKNVTIVYESVPVENGDTLTSIAQTHNDISVCSNSDYIDEVKRLNHILDNKICAGEYLVVPVYKN